MSHSDRARPMRYGFGVYLGAVLAALIMLATAPAALAKASIIPLSDSEINRYVKRLNLSDKQKPAVTSIMKRTRREGESVLKKHGVGTQSAKKPGLFQLVNLKKDMRAVISWARSEISKILSPVQMREFEKIYAEGAAILERRIRG